ncbi:MAG TPA: hypothetical protein VJ783_31015 [Pirellulales bacterium]|nr:hypothetical protein [Pirellulales bacterium]
MNYLIKRWVTTLLLLLPSIASAGDSEIANPLFRQLVERGIEAGTSARAVKLAEPSLADGLSGPEQKQAIERLVSKKYSYDQFVRKSAVAPFQLEIHSPGDGGQQLGKSPTNNDGLEGHLPKGTEEKKAGRVQQIDLWFVAYGTLQTVSDKNLLGELAGGNRSSQARSETLTDDELRKRELHVSDLDDFKESYFRIELPVLDKVQVSGITHATITRSDGGAVAAALLDPGLADDADYPARWRPILRGGSGKTTLGEPRAYAGLGGYCRVTELQEPAGAMFIECHLIFDEPHGWFNGTNLLRSKLPLVVQDSVRTFRRKLADAK